MNKYIEFFVIYVVVLTSALLFSNFGMPYLMPYLDKYIDKKYEKDFIIAFSITITMPFTYFIIGPAVFKLLRLN